MTLRVGVDVGGTNTDAVLMDAADRVLGRAKRPTTSDVVAGIREALASIVQGRPGRERVDAAMLGTTQCTNAVLERRGLRRVAVFRLGGPGTRAIPPFADWPEDLRSAVEGMVEIVPGGHEYTGREHSPLALDAVKRAAARAADEGLSIALVGVFSAVNSEHERRAAEVCWEVAGRAYPISLSSQIGSIGLLERENATILNAALTDIAAQAALAFQKAVHDAFGPARCYFTQNDGTLMSLEHALRYPSLMLASGPANSIRGAAYLSRLSQALVLDVGGTTSDIGMLVNGFPREAPFVVEVGGVRTNFRMPDVLSLALGGGSIVRSKGGRLSVGPQSVGYRLTSESRVFGGDTTTFTDIAVALGHADIGSARLLRGVQPKHAKQAYELGLETLRTGLEKMRPSADPIAVVAVGGGSELLPSDLGDGLELVRPRDHAVANAIGAAIAEVSGTVDRIVSLTAQSLDAARIELREEAMRQAISAGASDSSMRIVSWEEIPVAYLPGNAIRMRAKAAARLDRALHPATS